MSAVRMCDRCGHTFSERAEGWGTFSGTTQRRNERNGRRESVSEVLDLCPSCNPDNALTAPTGMLSIPGAEAADRLADINGGASVQDLSHIGPHQD